jgi:hypothetical protein
MNYLMKSVLVALSLLAVVLIVTACRGKVTESEARKMAEEKFLKVCANFKLDQASYVGPVVTNVAGFPFEFEWKKKPGNVGDGILIIIDDAGATNTSFVPQSNASDARPTPTK